jgi:hypothetical protein
VQGAGDDTVGGETVQFDLHVINSSTAVDATRLAVVDSSITEMYH